jgi:hypothetical protein
MATAGGRREQRRAGPGGNSSVPDGIRTPAPVAPEAPAAGAGRPASGVVATGGRDKVLQVRFQRSDFDHEPTNKNRPQ